MLTKIEISFLSNQDIIKSIDYYKKDAIFSYSNGLIIFLLEKRLFLLELD
jgi:hypothetical protein